MDFFFFYLPFNAWLIVYSVCIVSVIKSERIPHAKRYVFKVFNVVDDVLSDLRSLNEQKPYLEMFLYICNFF